MWPGRISRLEAYRRLATLSTHEEVDDVESEWTDRYGPLPKAAAALLGIAHLRAECVRLGLRDVTVVSGGIGTPTGSLVARISPVSLKASEQVRLGRVWPHAIYKEDQGQLVGPVRKGADPASTLVEILRALIPPVEGQVVAKVAATTG